MEGSNRRLEDEATVLAEATDHSVERSAPRVIASSSSSSSLASVTRGEAVVASPFEALRREEVQRTRFFLGVAIIMALVIVAASFVLRGDERAQAVLILGMAVIITGCGWLLWKIQAEVEYTLGRSIFVGFCCVMGAFSGVYFFGLFSPAPIILPFGLFFWSLSQSARATLAIWATCAAGLLVLFLGDLTGWLPDRGVLTAEELPLLDKTVLVGAVEIVVFATYMIGRASRRATLRAVEEHDRAMRQLAQRQALLFEARQQLDAALKGGLGRYTDQRLGSYRLGHVIGRGAMGEVYHATREADDSAAAVKVLHVEMLRDPHAVRRFMREAQIVASIDIAYVVDVLEIGGVDAPIPYIAMELLDGADLSEHLREHSRFSLKDSVRLAREVAAGLDAAHRAGVIHRDLKPGNLFFAREEKRGHVWKILDFGISKLTGTSHATLTRENAIVGTPDYMAPEQASGRPVSARSDVYALGAILYRALTGTPPFAGETLVQIINAVVNTMPQRPSNLVQRLPPDVDAVLAIALAKDPEDRFASAPDLAAALEQAADGKLSEELRARARRILETHPW